MLTVSHKSWLSSLKKLILGVDLSSAIFKEAGIFF